LFIGGKHGLDHHNGENWLDDPCHNYKPNVDLKEYLKEEDSLLEENYDLLEELDFF
jgi:hypothetical protein